MPYKKVSGVISIRMIVASLCAKQAAAGWSLFYGTNIEWLPVIVDCTEGI